MPARKPRGRARNGQGSIHYDPARGRWVGRVSIAGRRRTMYGASEADVVEKLRTLDRSPLAGTATVGELLERFLALEDGRAEDENLHPKTVEHRRAMLANFTTTPAATRRRVADLRSEHVTAALEAMADRGIARSSIKRAKSELARVLEWARDEGLTTRNPARAARMPTGIVERAEPRSLTVDELARIRAAAAASRCGLPIVDVGVGLCLRPGELLGLRWADVDFDAGTVRIEHSLQDDGTLGPVKGWRKTDRARATLKAPGSVMTALEDQRRRQLAIRRRRMASGGQWENLDLVFPTIWGTPTLHTNWSHQVGRLCARAGISPAVTPNELTRHTGASLLKLRGLSNDAIARFLRHTSTQMVDSVYIDEIADVIDVGAPDVLAGAS